MENTLNNNIVEGILHDVIFDNMGNTSFSKENMESLYID